MEEQTVLFLNKPFPYVYNYTYSFIVFKFYRKQEHYFLSDAQIYGTKSLGYNQALRKMHGN